MKLSIITINYNNCAGLEQTMKSVLSQTYRDYEYIIVDGASTDGSVDVMNGYASQIAALGVSVDAKSEKDSGLYNAMNKGVKKATGEYLLMLNSGDYLVDENVLERVLPELDGTDIVQGNRLEDHYDGLYRNRGYGKSNISFLDIQRGHFLHQASFCKKNLFEQYGYFDETYRYVSDTIFYIRTLGYGLASFRYIDIDVVNFDMNGFSNSSNPKIKEIHFEEEKRMQSEFFSDRLHQFCVDSERKITLYDVLHKNIFIWKFSMLLVSIVRLLYGKEKIVIVEPYSSKHKL